MPQFRASSEASNETPVIDYKALPKLLNRFSGKNVLLITRRHPDHIKDVNGEIIWISKTNHPKAVHPSRLHAIEQITWESLNNGVDGVILDALEYLMVEHGIEKTLKFVGKLRDMTMYKNRNFYVTISDGLDEKVLALLRRIVE